MENLSQEHIDYIKSFRLWLDSHNLNLSELTNDLDNSLKQIEIEKQHIDILKKRIENNLNYKNSSEKVFVNWCEENGINPKIEL